MSDLTSSSRTLGPDDRGMAQVTQLYKDISKNIDDLKGGLARRLVSQERHVIDTYVTQIRALKVRFEAEFDENSRKFAQKRSRILRERNQNDA